MQITIPDSSLVILCGPAACGKSTFARHNFRRTQIVSSDTCRALLCDSAAAQWCSGYAFELFHYIINRRRHLGRLTVADSTALSRSARSQLRKLAKMYNHPVILVAFDVSKESCIRHDQARRRRVGIEIISQQFEKMAEALAAIPREEYDQVHILKEADVTTARVRMIKSQ